MTLQSANKRFHLLPALAISLALHLLLLWPAQPARQAGRSATPLVAQLRPLVSATEALPPHASVRESHRAIVPRVQQTAVSAPLQSTTLNSTAAGGNRSDSAAGSGLTTPAVSVLAAATAGDGLDAEGLRGYRMALAREARRFKRYPDRALRAEWAGTAELRVLVTAGGAPQDVQLARSSGHPILDEAALEMVSRATFVARVPDSLRGRAFSVDLPVVFELPD